MHIDDRFLQALLGGARAWRNALDRHLKARGLTAAAWSALAAVVDSAAPPSQRALALQLGVDGATLVATIDRLAGARLVERLPGPHDRRVKLVAPTAAGRALAQQVTQEAAALRAMTVARLDSADLAVAATVLEQLQRLLEAP
jgi:MarR family transcriptional regulator for hemolysin